nr:ATP-binding protein [Desulfobacteraceae bacterium]
KKTAEELRAALGQNQSQLAQLDAIFNQMTDGLVIFDPEGNLLRMNPRGLEIHGFDDISGLRRHGRELAEIFELSDLDGHPLSEEQWPIGRVLNGETFRSYEVRVRRRDTGKTWIGSYGGAPVRDRQGHVLMNILSLRDITQIKQAEKELQKVQRLESIGLLAGGIAYDFNNILTAILGNISLARMFLPPGDKALERLDIAERASMRARGLSQQLLTFAKGGAPIKEAIEVPPVVKEAVDFALRGSRVRAVSSFPPDLRPVEADVSQLSQAISNLAINAVQAMPEGGVLSVTAANESLFPGNDLGLAAGEYVRIDVKDQGVGIPEEELKKIFDPYYTTKELGSGLGLSISFSIMKRHGGTITVDSTPGEGSTFSIFLPASEKSPVSPPKEAQQEAVPGLGRILVMDDEEAVSDIAAEMLRYLGYQTATVKEGAAAVSAYRQALAEGKPFAAVIVDLTIPAGMGGKETVRHLLEIDPQAKVIVSSGYANDPVMSGYLAYGFKGIIPKPFRLSDLSKTLEEVLGGKE